ncbi:MAG: head-tail connector protein [Burkholderiaceae bacterium]
MAFNFSSFEQTSRDVTTLWLTLPEVADQINLFGDESQDAYLTSLELATRMHIEDYLGVSFFTTGYRVWYDRSADKLDLPVGGSGVTVIAVKYWNNNIPAVLTTVATSSYQLDSTGARVIVHAAPTNVSESFANPIVVDYTLTPSLLAGYPAVKQAALLLLTHLYNQRSQTTETALKEIPFGVAALLRPYKALVM